MARYTITSGCGHTITMQLYGPERERSRRITWMESAGGKCNSCYAASKRSEENAAFEAEVAALLAKLLTQPTPTADVLAKLKGQAASGMGSPARREAFDRWLREIEG